MKIIKAGWVKYSNKLFPRYVPKHWIVSIDEYKAVQFDNFENAIIFEKLIEVEKKLEEKQNKVGK